MNVFKQSMRALIVLSTLALGCAEEAPKASSNLVGEPYPRVTEQVTGSPYQALLDLENRQGVTRDVSRVRGPNVSLRGQPPTPFGTNVGQARISALGAGSEHLLGVPQGGPSPNLPQGVETNINTSGVTRGGTGVKK